MTGLRLPKLADDWRGDVTLLPLAEILAGESIDHVDWSRTGFAIRSCGTPKGAAWATAITGW